MHQLDEGGPEGQGGLAEPEVIGHQGELGGPFGHDGFGVRLRPAQYEYEIYCKSGNICGTLIFAYFAQIQQARIQKPAKIFAVPKWQVSICSARI